MFENIHLSPQFWLKKIENGRQQSLRGCAILSSDLRTKAAPECFVVQVGTRRITRRCPPNREKKLNRSRKVQKIPDLSHSHQSTPRLNARHRKHVSIQRNAAFPDSYKELVVASRGELVPERGARRRRIRLSGEALCRSVLQTRDLLFFCL